MTTFSIFSLLISLDSVDYFTKYSKGPAALHEAHGPRLGRCWSERVLALAGALLAPLLDLPAQLEVRDRAGDSRQPEREGAVRQHRDRGQRERHTEGRE